MTDIFSGGSGGSGVPGSPIDARRFEDDLDRAGRALSGFAEGEAAQSLDRLSERFRDLGENLGDALERAAASGELSFQRLAASVAADLARIAAEQVLSGLFGGGGPGAGSGGGFGAGTGRGNQAFTFNFAAPSGGEGGGPFRAQGQIAAGVLRALDIGARFT